MKESIKEILDVEKQRLGTGCTPTALGVFCEALSKTFDPIIVCRRFYNGTSKEPVAIMQRELAGVMLLKARVGA